jgi:hypothetical protein
LARTTALPVAQDLAPILRQEWGIVEEETDEVVYWIEMLVDCGIVKQKLVEPLLIEANEIVLIIVSSIRTARANGRRGVTGKSAIRIPQSEITL